MIVLVQKYMPIIIVGGKGRSLLRIYKGLLPEQIQTLTGQHHLASSRTNQADDQDQVDWDGKQHPCNAMFGLNQG